MVLNDIERLMKNIPEIENIVTFYDDGTVFQTTFDKNSVNIPKLGNDLSTIISLFTNLQAKNDFKEFIKIIYDGANVSLIIFKVGEQSNIALFFKRELSDKELQNLQIRDYIDRIQELLDIDQRTLIQKDIEKKKYDLLVLENKQSQIEQKLEELESNEEQQKNKEELDKQITIITHDKKKLQEELEKLEKKIN